MMKKLDIEQAEPIRKKYCPSWEIRKGAYLYKKVAFDDYNQALRFFMVIEKPQIKLDHFADIGFFYNEVILMVYTHDVGGLTQLDFELALYIDKALEQMGARQLEENFADSKKFVEPNFSSEWEEAERYPEFVKIGKEAWIELAKKGKEFTIKSAKGINNTDAADPDSFKSLDPNKQKRALAQLKKGKVEMPIVAVYSDGYKELIGGNTRLTAMMARDVMATVWAFKVPDEVAKLAENFADGKVKGKSRPGRVSRAGASCNGSVTSLRKRAKNSSGEKARMYHWCANMKSGKNKKS